MMDVKARRQVDSISEVKKPKTTIFGFIRELKEELKKVSWTTKEELFFFTKIVVGATFFLGFAIYIVDLCIKGFLDIIAAAARWIFG